MKNPYWMLVGFLMFMAGILSFIFLMVGLKITFLNFIYNKGIFTLLFQIFLLFGGMMILYMSYRARLDEDEEEDIREFGAD